MPGPPLLTRRLFAGAAIGAIAGCAQPDRPLARPPQRALASARPPPEPAAASESLPPPRPPALPLFEAHPALEKALPHVPLGLFPTPVERAVDLERHLGIGALFLKRDDVSGAVYGGGKVRKLEFLLGEAQQGGHTTVITSGAVGSNQAVATAAYAAELGMKAILMLLPQPRDKRVREALRADLHFGGRVHLSHGHAGEEAAARRILLASGDRSEPYFIPMGGSSPLGNVGFVNAAFELRRDVERGLLPEPDVIYLALGTMGSAAGLALGLAALGMMKTRIVGVRASSPATSSEERLRAMLAGTGAHLRALDPLFPAVDPASVELTIAAGQLGAGYARPTRSGLRAMELGRERAGLLLEPTYTGKALAALVADAPALAGKTVLFWNTHSSRTIDASDVDARAAPAELYGYLAARR